MWVHFILPLLNSKLNSNPQSRDLILQLAERYIYLLFLSLLKMCLTRQVLIWVRCSFRIVSVPKARAILINGAVRKGERVVPPSALEVLMRITFPAPSARIKVIFTAVIMHSINILISCFCIIVVCDACYVQATERFEAVYPTLKEVALVAAPGSKAMKQLTQRILPFAIKAVAEGKAKSLILC